MNNFLKQLNSKFVVLTGYFTTELKHSGNSQQGEKKRFTTKQTIYEKDT